MFLYILALCSLVIDGKPLLEKRATQVSLINYTYTNGVLAGSINVSFSHIFLGDDIRC